MKIENSFVFYLYNSAILLIITLSMALYWLFNINIFILSFFILFYIGFSYFSYKKLYKIFYIEDEKIIFGKNIKNTKEIFYNEISKVVIIQRDFQFFRGSTIIISCINNKKNITINCAGINDDIDYEKSIDLDKVCYYLEQKFNNTKVIISTF